MPQPPRASGSRSKPPLKNPTSAKATFWAYTSIALALLNQYLDDEPRHIKYAEKQKQKQRHSKGATLNEHCGNNSRKNDVKHAETPGSSQTRPKRSNTFRKEHRMYPDPPQHSPYARPATPPRSSQREYYHRDIPARHRSEFEMYDEQRLSRGRRVDAWGRMRSVTPVKRVRFGGVCIHEYPHEHCDEDSSREGEGGEKEGARTQRDIPPPEKKKEPEKLSEIWGPVFPGDIWGPIFEDDIWGPVAED